MTDTIRTDNSEVIAALLKENAKLKAESAKLAEAKEIIKDLLGLKSSISSAKEAERRFVIREKAEKFLEEKK